ncbi:cell growth regulator with RING finger domain protein 1 [Hoplias malabaricus]|uniref:cell growth regulator with RING finger domain protein 1 n=1 Tax=Hoplias malabaricus TaxID=27720 RepID=UPI003462B3D5
MAAELLVKLYEYSPVFYISVISVCFIITAAAVLGWFGFDVPVILRSSDESESFSPIPEKRMVQVPNPFSLELGTTGGTPGDTTGGTMTCTITGTVTGGVTLKPYCLEECVLTCFWGCGVQALQVALQKHQYEGRLSTTRLFQEALDFDYIHCATFHVRKEEREECVTQIPEELGVRDFGFLPRDRYPLVAVLTLADAELTDSYNIVSSVMVLHVPDEKYTLSGRVLFQFLLTAQGQVYHLKPLYMSTDNSDQSGPEPSPSAQEQEEEGPNEEGAGHDEDREGIEDEEAEPGVEGKDCVVCQNAPVNRVLLPCRHTCLCDACVTRFQHCPMCRAFIIESFALANHTQPGGEEEEEEE